MYYFYLWTNSLGRTCFGITGHPENRRRKYEGHCGHAVTFNYLFEGPESMIRDLEDRIKAEFYDHLFDTSIGKYEWILESVPFDQVVGWVKWEIEETYQNNIVPCDVL